MESDREPAAGIAFITDRCPECGAWLIFCNKKEAVWDSAS